MSATGSVTVPEIPSRPLTTKVSFRLVSHESLTERASERGGRGRGEDAVATTRCVSAVGIVGLIWRVGVYKGRPGRGWWLRRGLFISSAVFAVAALAGCDSGRPAGKSAVPAASARTTVVCVTSAAKGSCGPYRYPAITGSTGQNTSVGQDVWSPISGWSQTLHATSPGNWYVTANMPAGNTAVVSFPNVGQEYHYTNTLAGFSSIYSSFTENMNPTSGTRAEAAYDIWLNKGRNEVMIQHDIVRRGTCPVRATAKFGGSGGVPVQDWNLCKYGSELIWQLSGAGEHSGTVDIRAMLTWLINHGYLPHRSGLSNISYGFEICSTGGRPETFRLSRYSISAVSHQRIAGAGHPHHRSVAAAAPGAARGRPNDQPIEAPAAASAR